MHVPVPVPRVTESWERGSATPRKRALVPGSATHPKLYSPHSLFATKITVINEAGLNRHEKIVFSVGKKVFSNASNVEQGLLNAAWKVGQ